MSCTEAAASDDTGSLPFISTHALHRPQLAHLPARLSAWDGLQPIYADKHRCYRSLPVQTRGLGETSAARSLRRLPSPASAPADRPPIPGSSLARASVRPPAAHRRPSRRDTAPRGAAETTQPRRWPRETRPSTNNRPGPIVGRPRKGQSRTAGSEQLGEFSLRGFSAAVSARPAHRPDYSAPTSARPRAATKTPGLCQLGSAGSSAKLSAPGACVFGGPHPAAAAAAACRSAPPVLGGRSSGSPAERRHDSRRRPPVPALDGRR